MQSGDQMPRLETKISVHRTTTIIEQYLYIATLVWDSGSPNAWGLRIHVPSNWNLQLLQNLATSDSDREVVIFLTYGWPISHQDESSVSITLHNHSSAENFLQHVDRYICKELAH